MNFAKKYWRECLIGGLLLANLAVWSVVSGQTNGDLLRVYFLDIGQGDAIFVDSPVHGRLLVDGGPNRSVLAELGKILPFGDKRLDVVMATHPDADHITGLIDVFRRYDVGAFIHPGVESASQLDEVLEEAVLAEGAQSLLARRGMAIDLGGGAKLVILFPDRDVSHFETNDASIVAKLVYGEKSFLLTGDAPKQTEYLLLGLGGELLDADVLKAGHHGSDTSTSVLFAEAVSPEYAVISAGKGNRYGHPKQSVLDILEKAGSMVVSTIDLGTIEFETDGEGLILK